MVDEKNVCFVYLIIEIPPTTRSPKGMHPKYLLQTSFSLQLQFSLSPKQSIKDVTIYMDGQVDISL